MDAEFWHQSWQRQEIGFHKNRVHHLLEDYFSRLQLAKGARVLVPLCGKSLDLLWLQAQGYEVVGVELSRIAVEEFFAENQLAFQKQRLSDFSLYQAAGLQIFCGDFFSLTPELCGPLAAAYDRAALVALPAEMRAAYAAQLSALLPAGAQLLTISFDYPQDQLEGPPFAVPEDEISSLFADRYRIEKLHSEAALQQYKKMQDAGVERLQEEVFLLLRR